MRIVFMTGVMGLSGASKMMAFAANSMARAGHEVHVVAFFSQECAQRLEPGVHFVSLGNGRNGSRLMRNTLGMVKTLCRLDSLVRKLRPDVAVTFLDSVGYVYLLVNRLLRRCCMVASERTDPHAQRGWTVKLRAFLLGFADGVVFQTQGAMAFYGGNRRILRRAEIIPNPVIIPEAMRTQLPQLRVCAAQRSNRIVTVGRLALRQKRQDVLLEAFRIVHAQRPETTLHIYGKGPSEAEIRRRVEALGLADCVTLEGETAQVLTDIHAARLFVLPSDYEGIPNALIEAMTVGVPCVSTDCSPGGARLLIRDGIDGFLVPRGDAQAMAERMLQLLDDPALCDRFSQEAVKIGDRFSEERIAGLWVDYLEDLVAEE